MLETRHAARRTMALNVPQPTTRFGAAAEVMIRPLAGDARFSLRLDAATAKAVGIAAGFNLDIPFNSWSGSRDRFVARLGPNEWLLVGPDSDAEVIAGQVQDALAEQFHVLVDIGHRNVAIEVSGRKAAEVLNSGCPLDLADSAFPAGTATRTLMGKAEILLMRLDDTPSYRVECWRSFASYVHEFLLDAAREFDPSDA